MIILVPTVAFFLAALGVGKRWILALPVIWWPLYFLGLHKRWWGHGVGDMWQYALVGVTLLGTAAAAAGLLLHALLGRAASPHRRAD
jgi:hypothetical protein